MTQREMIETIKYLSGETDENAVLAYFNLAKGKVLAQAFPYRDDVNEIPSKYESTTVEIAVYMLNKRGAEGEQRHSEGGIDRTYDNGDVPTELLRKITPCVGVM